MTTRNKNKSSGKDEKQPVEDETKEQRVIKTDADWATLPTGMTLIL
jgi:hypothetical protein